MVRSQPLNDGVEHGAEDTGKVVATEVSTEAVSIWGDRQGLVALAELFRF